MIMNTTAKGDAFENKAYKAIKDELDAKKLGILPHSCQIFQKKAYYSKDRGSDIIVDISIEVALPEAGQWSFLWVWECKDNTKALDVSEVEEFDSKLRQIAGRNIKGCMAVSGGLQSAALNYARSRGIGVVRLMPEQQVHWVLYQSHTALGEEDELDANEFLLALVHTQFESENRDFYAMADDYIFGDWYSLVREIVSSSIKIY